MSKFKVRCYRSRETLEEVCIPVTARNHSSAANKVTKILAGGEGFTWKLVEDTCFSAIRAVEEQLDE